jgi:hypothetical protein
MLHQRASRFLRSATAAAMLFLGVSACDRDVSDEEIARALPCNLADEECAALPIAADAFVVLESMNIDPDEANVELVEDLQDALDEVPEDEPWSANALKIEEPPPEAQAYSCNGDFAVVRCCCFWDGPAWGCICG